MASEIKWIKITTDMFEDEKIDFISNLPESDAIIVIWLRILTLAGKCNAGGYVMLTEKIPYTEEMLAHKFRKPLNVVKLALETFRRLDMIEMDGESIFLPNWEKHQNIEGMQKIREQTKNRVAKHRQKAKELHPPPCNVTVTDDVTPSNATELDIDLDKEKEINISTTTHGSLATIADVHRIIFRQLQIPPIMTDYISRLLNQGVHENLIMEAMYECGESSANPNKRLLESIIDRWIKEGISSREENRQRKQQEKRPNIPTNRSGQAPDRLKNGRPVFTVVSSEKEENPLTPEELEELHRLAAKLDGKGEPA